MYGNVGLQTPRGSGTNGYIQRNLSYVAPKRTDMTNVKPFETEKESKKRKYDVELLEHERKRKIEIEIMKLEDELTEKGYSEEKIQRALKERRSVIEKRLRNSGISDKDNLDSHQSAFLKERKMEEVRKALKISQTTTKESTGKDETSKSKFGDGHKKKRTSE